MAGPYIKLFGSILNSSIWCEAGDTRLVWITLLLLADAEGYVWGAVPGVARQAAVSVDACEAALEILARPDPYSRSREEDGRRIIPVDGGWKIVNARKYREMQTSGQRKASERSKNYRNRHGVTQRDDRDASRLSRTEGEEESEGKGEGKKQQTDSASSDAIGVLNYWQERTKTKIRSPKAHQQILTRIKARLRDGCSVTDMKACVEFALVDEFYSSKGYSKKPDVLWRNAERVGDLANRYDAWGARSGPPAVVPRHGPTPEELAALDAESDR